MTQRTLAGLLAVPALVALWLLALQEPLPYVTYAPGLTVNVLGDGKDGKPVLDIKGTDTYRDDGELRLTTVLVTPPESDVNLFQLLGAWLDPDATVYPYDTIYGPSDTNKSKDQEGEIQMASSQDAAVAAALSQLDMHYGETPQVVQVVDGSPAQGVFEKGDLIRSVEGKRVRTPAQVGQAVEAVAEQDPVHFVVVRDGQRQQLAVKRKQMDGGLKVGILMGSSFDFPIDVSLGINPDIGGPSAGLMFSLAVYDTLTKGSMTDGQVIAGTGTIAPNGDVGPIGGIDQKIAGAREDGAELFLVPADNCGDAADSPHGDMELVRVSDMGQAVDAVETWAADRDAQLPQCTDPGESSE